MWQLDWFLALFLNFCIQADVDLLCNAPWADTPLRTFHPNFLNAFSTSKLNFTGKKIAILINMLFEGEVPDRRPWNISTDCKSIHNGHSAHTHTLGGKTAASVKASV